MLKRGVSLAIQCENVEEAVRCCCSMTPCYSGDEAGGYAKGEPELQPYISEIQHELQTLRETPEVSTREKNANLIKGSTAVSLGPVRASTEARHYSLQGKDRSLLSRRHQLQALIWDENAKDRG